jgi:5-hydroxyisourate hydrolase
MTMPAASPITTHVLDTALGKPAAAVPVSLEIEQSGAWKKVGSGATDSNGRLQTLLAPGELAKGRYRLTFDTESYFAGHSVVAFYPRITVVFVVRDTVQHYHVPLLLSPYGYSTYRGS